MNNMTINLNVLGTLIEGEIIGKESDGLIIIKH